MKLLTTWTDKDLRDEERAERLARAEESALNLANLFVWTVRPSNIVEVVR